MATISGFKCLIWFTYLVLTISATSGGAPEDTNLLQLVFRKTIDDYKLSRLSEEEIKEKCPQLWAITDDEFNRKQSEGILGSVEKLNKLCPQDDKAEKEKMSLVCQGAIGISSYLCKSLAGFSQTTQLKAAEVKNVSQWSTVDGTCSTFKESNLTDKLMHLHMQPTVISVLLSTINNSSRMDNSMLVDQCKVMCDGDNIHLCHIFLQGLRTVENWEEYKIKHPEQFNPPSAQGSEGSQPESQATAVNDNTSSSQQPQQETRQKQILPSQQAPIPNAQQGQPPKPQQQPEPPKSPQQQPEPPKSQQQQQPEPPKSPQQQPEPPKSPQQQPEPPKLQPQQQPEPSKPQQQPAPSKPQQQQPGSLQPPQQQQSTGQALPSPPVAEKKPSQETAAKTEPIPNQTASKSLPKEDISTAQPISEMSDENLDKEPALAEDPLNGDGDLNPPTNQEDATWEDEDVPPNENEGPMIDKPSSVVTETQSHGSDSYIDEPEDTHFILYFITFAVLSVAGYIIYVRRNRIIAMVIEGRGGSSSRRRGSVGRDSRPSSGSYRKLVNHNLEEVITSSQSVKNSNVIY